MEFTGSPQDATTTTIRPFKIRLRSCNCSHSLPNLSVVQLKTQAMEFTGYYLFWLGVQWVNLGLVGKMAKCQKSTFNLFLIISSLYFFIYFLIFFKKVKKSVFNQLPKNPFKPK